MMLQSRHLWRCHLCALLGMLPALAAGQTQPWGQWATVWAAAFGQWSVVSSTPVAGPGVYTLQIGTGSPPAIAGGPQFQPLAAGVPLLVGSGADQETATPTAVRCDWSAGSCTVTLQLARAHPAPFPLRSGTAGLQEAINYAHRHGGGVVVLDWRWGGNESLLAAATGFDDVVVRDDRVPLRWLVWTSGGYQADWTMGPAGAGTSPPPMRYGGLTDYGPMALSATATGDLHAGGFDSTLRLSMFADQGGTYGSAQPAYPVINGEAVGRTQGQVGGLFTYNVGYGLTNVQGVSGVSQCWGGAEPTSGGSYVQCSALGEEDIEPAARAAIARLSSAPAAGATELPYTPVANESVAGARQWFDVSQPEIVGSAAPTGCGIAFVSGSSWTLTGSGCSADAGWVGKYLIPNTTAFWYAAAGGACGASPSDYTTDGTNCIGTPYLITSVASATSLGTFATLDSRGLVDMHQYGAVGAAVRKSGTVTMKLAQIPNWTAGTPVVVGGCSDSSFDGEVTVAAASSGAAVDNEVSYPQAGGDATATGCVAQHAPIPFVVVDGIVAQDVDVIHHVLRLPPNSKSWDLNDELVSPPTPWIWTVGLNLNIAKNYPAENMKDSLAPLGDGIRIRALGPFPLNYGLEFYGNPPTGSGGIDTLIGLQPGFGPVRRGLDLSAQAISDCALCVGASDGHSNKIKFGAGGEGDGQIFFDGALELRGPAGGSVRIGDTGGLSAWTFSHASGQVTVSNAQGQRVLLDNRGEVTVGNAGEGVVLGDGGGAPIKGHYSASANLAPAAPTAVPGCAPEVEVALPGAGVGDAVDLGVPVPWQPNQIAQAWVSAPGQVSIRVCQFGGAASAPASGVYRVDVWAQ